MDTSTNTEIVTIIPPRKKKVLFLTDPHILKTGLSRNITCLLKHLWKTNKYDLVHACCGVIQNDPALNSAPWKCIGVLPPDQNQLNQLQSDQNKMRAASYGFFAIDQIIEQEKPDVFIGINDSWSFDGFHTKEWFKKINSVLHITLDSLPIAPAQQQQAAECKNYYCWTSFAEKELKRLNKDVFGHVKTRHAALDTTVFHPVSLDEKKRLKKKFGIDEDTVVIGMVSRNQLRKLFHVLIEGLVIFKKNNPDKKVKVLLHTTNEQWPLQQIIYDQINRENYAGILKNEDILFTYYCKNCRAIEIKPLCGNDLDCPYCKAKGQQIVPNIKECCDVPTLVNEVYGVMDAYCHSFTSGACELGIVESMLCGLPAAVTNYSCGTTFCANDFVFSLPYTKNREVSSCFWKATPLEDFVAKFYKKMWELGDKKRQELGMRGRTWALKEFSIENVGPLWEKTIDDLPFIDYINLHFSYKVKPETYELKNISDDREFIRDLYKGILLIDVNDTDKGLQDWVNGLQRGQTRSQILEFFINVAKSDNAKNRTTTFDSLLGSEGKDNRILVCLPESFGDLLAFTSLLKDLRECYSDKKIYFATKSQFMPVLHGISYIDHIIEWQQFMDNSMEMEAKYFKIVLQAHFLNQRIINYLHGNSSDVTKINFKYNN